MHINEEEIIFLGDTMAIGKYYKTSILAASIILILVIAGCQKTPTAVSNSGLYNFCLQNNGTVFGSALGQCNSQGLIYFQSTDNAINIQFCTSYYDGCNTCTVDSGVLPVAQKWRAMITQEPQNA
jgi:hypothetical protein